MTQPFSPRTQAVVGVVCFGLQLALLLVLLQWLHMEAARPVKQAIAAAGGFLVAAVLVFPAWAVSGPVYGVTSVLIALIVAVAPSGAHFGIGQAMILVVPVAVAMRYRTRLVEMANGFQGREEHASAELVELERVAADKDSKRRAFERRVARIPHLCETCQRLGASLDAGEVLRAVVSEAATGLDNSDHALLFLQEDQDLKLVAAYPTLSQERLQACQPQEVDRFVFKNGKPYLCARASSDVYRFTHDEPGPVASFVAAPIRAEDPSDQGARTCVGVLRVTSSRPDALSRADMDALNIIAALAGMSIQNAALYDRCKQLAIIDTLTGLNTPSYFRERFAEELKRSARESAPLSFLMMDIDDFKAYNDTYGHSAGDTVLRNIADVLRANSESGDILVRYGGEEFGALRQTDAAPAKAWAERLRASVEQAQLGVDMGSKPLTISIGASSFPSDGVEVDELIEVADKAMYRAKEAGKNRVC